MRWMNTWLCLFSVMLAACETGEAIPRPHRADPQPVVVDADADPADLYFEMTRLASAGLVDSVRMSSLQRSLDEVDFRYTGAQCREQARQVLAATLRRTYDDLLRGEDRELLEARVGQSYARQLNRAGVRAAQQSAEGLILAAGMLGVPTSGGDVVLMVAVPVGGYVVVKVTGIALKRVPFLLRRFSTVDEVVDGSRVLGLRPGYAATENELRQLAGAEAARFSDSVPHVGMAQEAREGKPNLWNPSDRKDNCTACVTAVLGNHMEGYFKYSADEIEKLFGYTGRERRFSPRDALDYIEKVTGLKAGARPVSMLGPKARVGHYAVMTRWEKGVYQHVLYGRVSPSGRVTLFDPQSMQHLTYEQMLADYGGKAAPYLLELAE